MIPIIPILFLPAISKSKESQIVVFFSVNVIFHHPFLSDQKLSGHLGRHHA
jgi:hypothetical protein